jgi:hypothetical protein
LLCYAWNLCEIYDVTCCSENPKKHLPYLCEFNDNEILSSYAKGVYSYYDIKQIEEFVAFKGAHEVASLIEKYDTTLYKSEILPYLNIAMKTMLPIPMLVNSLGECLLLWKRIMICMNL